jgi:hypothetical protein
MKKFKKFMLFVIVILCYTIPLAGQAAKTEVQTQSNEITLTEPLTITVDFLKPKVENGNLELKAVIKITQNIESFNDPTSIRILIIDSLLNEMEKYQLVNHLKYDDEHTFLTVEAVWVKDFGADKFRLVHSSDNP